MKANIVRSTWIAFIVAVILLVITSPSIASTPMESTNGDCDYNSYQGGITIPQCCLMSDSPLSHCIFTNTADTTVLHTSRFIPNKIVYLAWSKTDVITETSLNPKKPLQWAPAQELPSYNYTEYHCRNCLNSEEPPQV